jgi:hypothetical protein
MVALAFLALGVLAFWLAEPWSLYLMPQAGLAALAAAALSAVLRLWPAAGGFALAGAVALAPVAPLYLPRGTPVRPGCHLSIVSFNTAEMLGPFMRIDYIFHDGSFAPTIRRIDDASGAEHCSVQADLAFAG